MNEIEEGMTVERQLVAVFLAGIDLVFGLNESDYGLWVRATHKKRELVMVYKEPVESFVLSEALASILASFA